MIPFATNPSLNEWERALCAAAFRSKTFVSQRDKIANEDLRNQHGITEPWNLKKGRTKNYLERIFEEPRIHLWDGGVPSIDMVMSPTFVFEEPCVPSLLLATTVLTACSAYWNGLLPQIDRFKFSNLRPLNEYDLAWIAVMMNRTSAFNFYGTTYSFIPFLMKVASLVGIYIHSASPLLPPDSWHIFGVGRQFIGPEFRFDSIRDVPSPVVALAEELVYRSGLFYSGFYSHGFPLREIFEFAAAHYLAVPKWGDLRDVTSTTHSITGSEIIKIGSDWCYKY